MASSVGDDATAEDVAGAMKYALTVEGIYSTEWITAEWVEAKRAASAEFMEALKETNKLQAELGNPQPLDDDDLPEAYRAL